MKQVCPKQIEYVIKQQKIKKHSSDIWKKKDAQIHLS